MSGSKRRDLGLVNLWPPLLLLHLRPRQTLLEEEVAALVMVPVLHAAIAAMDVRLMVAGRILANEQDEMRFVPMLPFDTFMINVTY